MRALLLSIFLCSAYLVPGASADEKEINEAIAAYVKAFNSHDVEAVSKMWAPNAVHLDLQLDEETIGRDEIVADLKEAFELSPELKISGKIDHVKMIRDDIASVNGIVTVSSGSSDPSSSQFSAILVKQADGWAIDKMEESPVRASTNARSALDGLSWLVGHWTDTSETSNVDTVFAWSKEEQFLIRTTEVTKEDGLTSRSSQVIGWDARNQSIRSWTFHSDGSFGEAQWSNDGDVWAIDGIQTLADGSLATGTYVLQKVDKDSFTIQLIDREIEGEPQPTTDPVKMTRAADATPATTTPK